MRELKRRKRQYADIQNAFWKVRKSKRLKIQQTIESKLTQIQGTKKNKRRSKQEESDIPSTLPSKRVHSTSSKDLSTPKRRKDSTGSEKTFSSSSDAKKSHHDEDSTGKIAIKLKNIRKTNLGDSSDGVVNISSSAPEVHDLILPKHKITRNEEMKMILSEIPVKHLVPRPKWKFNVPLDTTPSEALNFLAENAIAACAIVSGEYIVGVLHIIDILQYIMGVLSVSDDWEHKLFSEKSLSTLISIKKKPLIPACQKNDPVLKALEFMSSGNHRIPTFSSLPPNSPSFSTSSNSSTSTSTSTSTSISSTSSSNSSSSSTTTTTSSSSSSSASKPESVIINSPFINSYELKLADMIGVINQGTMINLFDKTLLDLFPQSKKSLTIAEILSHKPLLTNLNPDDFLASSDNSPETSMHRSTAVRQLIAVDRSIATWVCIEMLWKWEISSVAVIDFESGRLVDVISTENFIGINISHLGMMLKPVIEFLRMFKDENEGGGIQEKEEKNNNNNNNNTKNNNNKNNKNNKKYREEKNFKRKRNVSLATPEMKMKKLIRVMNYDKNYRVWIVDDLKKKHVMGVIAFSDILSYVVEEGSAEEGKERGEGGGGGGGMEKGKKEKKEKAVRNESSKHRKMRKRVEDQSLEPTFWKELKDDFGRRLESSQQNKLLVGLKANK
eukprot:TRINITY_DN2885_c0_g5_i1.p1 TRINITY_DN2885_c0_g5~~TRINITY_DN2885_c0_g5_i1.p1  ORF type:complete len:771 (-),score=285.25 TRINITY_DN2885_c0_g5_i1:191-2200(-)